MGCLIALSEGVVFECGVWSVEPYAATFRFLGELAVPTTTKTTTGWPDDDDERPLFFGLCLLGLLLFAHGCCCWQRRYFFWGVGRTSLAYLRPFF